ncbi:hypothetical protein DYB25_012140 [Aphanomyces astaci]|uniref:Endonuclease/exonuclease/phosphatase domain-containing protein n=1 Tax=Aphanomyces astaci TaxID=112090 RepID=A0A397C179_APHAT|nr:hypothetical protein DYB25_012140 [Aphanomyces astaci]RHZ10100.1 hypothetical protein DYB31_007927 [Aphanomyces astaci]
MDRPSSESHNFYDSLRTAYCCLPYRDTTILCGDFNIKLGYATSLDNFRGRWTRCSRSRNGLLLAKACDELKLVAFNTLFQRPATQLTTSCQPRDTHHLFNQIDYILGH